MSLSGRLAKRLRAAISRRRLEREMQDEMAAHIAESAARFRNRGLAAPDALLAARREFGNVAALQEEARDARGQRWLESVVADLRHTARQWRRAPILTLTILATLTLGIGTSAAAFAILSGVLARPAPGVPADPALVTIRGVHERDGLRYPRRLPYPELMEYARLPGFESVSGWTSSLVVTRVAAEPPSVALAQFVTPNYFGTLGLQLAAGAGFVRRQGNGYAPAELTAVLGHLYAVQLFGSPTAALGRSLTVNGTPVQVVGVAPPRFLAVTGGGESRTLWLPVSAWPVVDRGSRDRFTDWSDSSFATVARLRPGVAIDRTLPAVALVASRTAEALARLRSGELERPHRVTADVVPLRGDVRVKSSRADEIELAGLVGALVALVLLVCTMTVSSLLTGAGLARRQELATRLALGASRSRLVRQLVTETTALALLAGGLGLGVYALLLRGLGESAIGFRAEPTLATGGVAVLVALATSILCALSPALHATRHDGSGSLQESGRTVTSRSRLQRLFVVAQVSLSQPLLVGLAMLIGVLAREGSSGANPTADSLALLTFDAWAAPTPLDNRIPAIRERLATWPGVVAVLPQVTGFRLLRVEAAPGGSSRPRRFRLRTHQVPTGYFETVGPPLQRGRALRADDTTAAVVPVVIDAAFAAQAFGGGDPIGQRLTTLGWEDGRRTGDIEVVGVVPAVPGGRGDGGSAFRVFVPMGGPLAIPDPGPDAVLIRTRGPAAPLIAGIENLARAESPMTPLRSVQTLAQIEHDARAEVLQAASASAAAGIVTLLLASIGLYALVALAVGLRRREIGVRAALGARPGQVVLAFFRSGLAASGIGLLLGLPLSVVALKIAVSRWELPPVNLPAIAAGVALAVILIASLASWIPARRAARVDPLEILRDG